MSLIKRAEEFAKRAHGTQVRKYTGEPYWLHCREVALLVEASGGTDEQIAAAWLHDTVEDTGTLLAQIESEFGHGVASLVYWLTDVSRPMDGNREARKTMDRAHTAQATPAAQTVKLADLISNSCSISRHDKDFARVYMAEKAKLIPLLEAGNPILFTLANDILSRYQASLLKEALR